MNRKRWMIKRCTGMRKHLKRGKYMIDKAWIESTGEERMKNDKLEAPLVSSWESPDKNIDGKEWRNFTKNKRILGKEILVLEEKRGVGGEKQRQLGDGWNKQDWENLSWSCGCWSDPLEEKYASWKGLSRQSQLSRRISIYIGIWEHHLGKVWNQHLTSKQLE